MKTYFRNLLIMAWLLALGLGVLLPGAISHAVTLTGLDVQPADSSILVGQNQPFTATGTFSDGSTRTLSTATLSGGVSHTCAALLDGTVRCWGSNSFGELGDAVDSNGSDMAVVVIGIQSAVAIGSGVHHNCVILADTTVRCWGRGITGQLGDGTATDSSTPVEVGNFLRTVVALDAGAFHTCAVRSDGTVACWGSNVFGQLGIGTDSGPEACNGVNVCSSIPVDVIGIDQAIGIASGRSHTCAVLSDGTVQCWGSNSHGQLGIDPNLQTGSTVPIPVAGIETATALAAGVRHTCALLSDGTIRCWGNNFPDGELGDGTQTNSFTPVAVSGIGNAVAVTSGSDHVCALLSDGAIHCWGDNTYGQLGDGSAPADSFAPVAVSGISNAVSVGAGITHTCAVLSDGAIRCWGRGEQGQLGDGDTTNSPTPVKVVGVDQPAAVTAVYYNTCALLLDGTLNCWGDNSTGQLSNGTVSAGSLTPAAIREIDTAIDVSAAGYPICVVRDGLNAICRAAGHTCVVLEDGTVSCWGANNGGQIGASPVGPEICGSGLTATACSTTPVAVSGISNAVSVSAGNAHTTCAVLSGGIVNCWGANGFGQLGDGTQTDSFTPVAVNGISNAVAVSAGSIHTCAMLSDGTINCWGSNNFGRLGDGSNTDSSTPVAVNGISNAVAVSAGGSHTCAVLSDGAIHCWGNNGAGQLGDGTQTDSFTPVAVSGINTAVAVSAGGSHTCAVLSDGTVNCWGRNEQGEIGVSPLNGPEVCGVGPITCSTTPVAVSGISTAVAVSAGEFHTCAVLSDRTVQCWGWNGFGQLGDGTGGSSVSPVRVLGLSIPTFLAWQSSDPFVAGINWSGIATGLSPGSATISALSANGVTSNTSLGVGVNAPPSAFELISPADGETGLPTEVTFVWNAATDPDGDAVTYELFYCENQDFSGCAPVQVALLMEENVVYAGLGVTGAMLLLFMGVGFGFGRPLRTRAILSLCIILLASGMSVSCGGGGGGAPIPSTGEVSQTVSGLKGGGTQYFWKVVADDGRGGQTESETRSFTTQ